MSDTPTTTPSETTEAPTRNWKKAALWCSVAVATLTAGAIVISKINKDEVTLTEVVDELTTE